MAHSFYKFSWNTILFIVCLSINTYSQQNYPQFEHITVADGLPQNSVFSILKDELGFLWFATQNGLVKYDGYNFTIYSPDSDNPNSIASRNLRTIIEDSYGIIWIGSWVEGLIRFDPETEKFTNYVHSDTLPTSLGSDVVQYIYEDKSGEIWIGTGDNGLDKFERDTESFIHYRYDHEDPYSISSNSVNALAEDKSGNLWVGTGNGLNLLENDSGKFTRYYHDPRNSNSLISNQITYLYEDYDGVLWIGTGNGLSHFDISSNMFSNFQNDQNNPNSLSQNRITVIAEDNQRNIWIGTLNAGVNKFDRMKKSFTRYRENTNNVNSLSGDWVRSIYNDESGVLWIGCWLTGLNKLDLYSHKFEHLKHNPGDANTLNDNFVWSLFEDSNEILWIGTNGGGLNRYDISNELFEHFRFNPNDIHSISGNRISYIFEDTRGTLWITTYDGGLNKLVPGTSNNSTPSFIRFQNASGNSTSLSNTATTTIYEDSEGTLWIGTINGGMNKVLMDDVTHNIIGFEAYYPTVLDGLNHSSVNIMLEDSKGRFWVGTDGAGLYEFDRETAGFKQYYDKKIGFETILNLHEDKSGRLWVGTYYGGLFLFNPESGESEIFTEKNGLLHNTIKGILEDESGNLWIGTERGLSRFNYEKKTFTNYDVTDGLQNGHFNFNGAFKNRDGKMYFGGINGVNYFYPDKIVSNPQPPPIVFTDFKIFNQSVSYGQNSALKKHINFATEVNLSYLQNDITIEFAALNYSRTGKNIYSYKLDGYDSKWSTEATQNKAVYTNLNPGEYTFLVKGANSDGVWNKNPASLKIIIIPPFWQTIWFKIVIALIVLSIILIGYKIRIRQLDQKRKSLEERVAERTQDAKKIKEALDEVEILKNRLQAENVYLQSELKVEHNFEDIISSSEKFNLVLRSVEQVAETDSTVLILGETGTGKELLARAIHNISNRADRPLVKVNCATLPENLIESELFGHDKGAFTGAIARKIGRFELAHRGTIFLDEIGELPLVLQTKLLRVLQEGEFERLGNSQTKKVDVRVITATNRNLENEIAEGSFREDLFYRLNVFPIKIPPLRDRREDIPILTKHFLKKYNTKTGKNVEIVTQEVMEKLEDYTWPGNVRELENIIERAVITSVGDKLILGDWISKTNVSPSKSKVLTLEEMEKNYILEILNMMQWKVSGEKGAAKILNINPQTLVSRMKKLGIQKPK